MGRGACLHPVVSRGACTFPADASPDTPLTSTRLSQFLALALAAFTWWVMTSRPGVVDPAFAVEIHAAFAVILAILFGLAFFALRLATRGATAWWSTGRTDQVRPVGRLIVAVLGVMLAASAVLHAFGRADPVWDEVAYLLAGSLVPALFLQLKLVTWPARSGRPGRLSLVLVGGVSLGLAAAWSYAAYSVTPDALGLPPSHELIVVAGAVILGATFEEVLCRVLLVTALLDRIGSRLQAVFLSSVVFGLMHVPGRLSDPIMHGDWAFLQQAAFDYAPVFLLQTFLGLILGVIWLRFGSLTLIAAVHAVLNLGSVIGAGLLARG